MKRPEPEKLDRTSDRHDFAAEGFCRGFRAWLKIWGRRENGRFDRRPNRIDAISVQKDINTSNSVHRRVSIPISSIIFDAFDSIRLCSSPFTDFHFLEVFATGIELAPSAALHCRFRSTHF